MKRIQAVTTVAGLVALVGVSGCSAVGLAKVPTCSEYAAMSSTTGLMSDLSDDQKSAIDNILTKHDRKSDASNQLIAATQIVAFCNIYSGKASSHKDDPIDGIPGLKD